MVQVHQPSVAEKRQQHIQAAIAELTRLLANARSQEGVSLRLFDGGWGSNRYMIDQVAEHFRSQGLEVVVRRDKQRAAAQGSMRFQDGYYIMVRKA